MEIISKNLFEEKVLKADKKVLVDFYADWCGPCKALSPIVEEICSEVKDIYFYKINIDKDQDLAVKYGIMSIPALYLFDKGNVVNKSIGLVDKNKILDLLK